MYLFTIEGNIGSGKSTFLASLKDNLKEVYGIPVIYIPEPVKEWEEIKSEDGKNMIELFYEDQNKYAFSFQMMAYITRLHYLRQEIAKYPKCILISERSLMADYHVFAQMLYDDKKIEDVEFQIYKKWFDEFMEELPAMAFIYIRADPIKSFQRVNKRARDGEKCIPLSYLENCHKYHENWLFHENKVQAQLTNNIGLLTLNGNADINANADADADASTNVYAQLNIWTKSIHDWFISPAKFCDE